MRLLILFCFALPQQMKSWLLTRLRLPSAQRPRNSEPEVGRYLDSGLGLDGSQEISLRSPSRKRLQPEGQVQWSTRHFGSGALLSSGLTLFRSLVASCSILLLLSISALPLGAQTPVTIMTTGRDCATIYLDTPFSCQFVADGGTPPYHWTAPNLPPGLTMSDSGLLSGTVPSCSPTVVSNCVHIPANPQGMKVLVAGQTLNLKVRKHEPSKKAVSRRAHPAAA